MLSLVFAHPAVLEELKHMYAHMYTCTDRIVLSILDTFIVICSKNCSLMCSCIWIDVKSFFGQWV